jgi:hypothetical protein
MFMRSYRRSEKREWKKKRKMVFREKIPEKFYRIEERHESLHQKNFFQS